MRNNPRIGKSQNLKCFYENSRSSSFPHKLRLNESDIKRHRKVSICTRQAANKKITPAKTPHFYTVCDKFPFCHTYKFEKIFLI